MTDKEKANNYEMDCIPDVYKDDVCTIPYAYSAQKLEQAYLDGLAEGEKIGKKKQRKATKKAQKKTSEKIKELKVKISSVEDELLQEKIKNNDLEERLKKAKEILPAWQSIQI